MRLRLEWTRPIPLRKAKEQNALYGIDIDKLPRAAGLYILGRRYGASFEALYVGKANNIRSRLRSQLNNLRLMQHLRNASAGKRIVFAGQFTAKPGQQQPKCLALAERALIRHFLSEGHDLVNQQGTRLRRHEIASDGKYPKRYFPRLIYLERGKGE
jgi:hypothetical protein